jgi:ADP-ribose pyrophosphatase YjhB (NUDIX family)
MKYCSQCATPVVYEIPEADNRPRYNCKACGQIYYHNPKMIVGTIPIWKDKVLLCLRNIEPRKGFWTLPAGYLESNESVEQGARRETLEETGASLANLLPYRMFDIVHISQIYFMFLADLKKPEFHATEESLDVRLFKEEDIPWDEIAFPVVHKTLDDFFKDRNFEKFTFEIEPITERIGK